MTSLEGFIPGSAEQRKRRSSLKEPAGVKRGLCLYFRCLARDRAYQNRVRDLPGLAPGVACFPVAAIPVERAGGSRTGRSPAASAAPQGVLEATARDPIIGRRERGGVRLCSGPTVQPCVGQAPGCGHPFGVPAVAGRGGMGRSACGQRDQSEARPRRPGAGARPAADRALPASGLLTRPRAYGGGPGT
jgi:hypothetical protein